MEKRLTRLKGWRQVRSKELELDPGVLAPNACLEAVTIAKPSSIEALSEIPEIKKWFAESFGHEILDLLANDDNDTNEDEPTEAKPRKRSSASKKRRRRKTPSSSNASDVSNPDTDPTK
jgi:ribonuclease D